MDTASKVLVVGGLLNLMYGFLTGFPAALIRRRQPEMPRHLRFAHIGPLMQGPMLLGLVFAVQLSDLSNGLETVAAWLLAVGAGVLALGDTLLWLRGTTDSFAERPPPFGAVLTGGASVVETVGLGILLVGVFAGL